VGGVYFANRKDAQAEINYREAFDHYSMAGYKLGQVRALGNIANVLIYENSLPQALEYAQKAEGLAQASKDGFIMGIATNTLARVYEKMQDYELAEQHALRGIQLDTINPAPHYITLAIIYVSHKKYDEASAFLTKTETAKSLNQYTPMTIALYRARIAMAHGNKLEAEMYDFKGRYLQDSLNLQVSNVQRKNSEQESYFLQEQKESSERTMMLVIYGCMGTLALAFGYMGYYFFIQYWYKSESMLRKNYEQLRQIDEQQYICDIIEGRAYGRMVRKGLMTHEQLDAWNVIVDEEMDRFMMEKIEEHERRQRKWKDRYGI
jgi:tetratricopeptide (TPR) repeat protein